MRPLRIGLMGCADIARRRVLPAIAAAPDAELVAVASRDAARAADTARRFGGRPVHGYEALLELADVEAIYVPLPPALHARWVEAALRAGRPVLAEKPLTTSAAETGRLLALAAERGLVLMENVMFVHHGQHAVVQKLVAEGRIGEPRSFHAAFAIPRRPDGDIRHRADLGGGALWDTGLYPVRAALHLLGPDLTVAGATAERGPGRKVDTWGTALLRSSGGVAAHLTFGLDNAYTSGYALWGSEGKIIVDRAFTPPADHRPALLLERPSGTEELVLEPDDQVARTVAAFVAAVRNGSLAPGAADCLRQAELLDDIRTTRGVSCPR
ncbi:Gfo/Idh/MocA family protein [Actinomadura nitritigenes]|uniref:Gfo/Idh/MocA family protein n=1 Tax=Actinomadura nitritigenes TaxID=134602 RepID=UPI00367D1C74